MIKRKCIFSGMLTVALLAGLCGCGKTSPATGSGSTAPDSVTSEPVEPVPSVPVPSDQVQTDLETTTPEPVVEEPDPYDVLKADESFKDYYASSVGYNIYLLRNGNYYSLSSFISAKKAKEYQVGQKTQNQYVANTIANNGDYYLSLGNIPVVITADDDIVIGVGRSTLGLTPATLVGYSIRMVTKVDPSFYCILYPSIDEQVQINVQGVKQFEMVDSQGNAVPQVVGYATGGDNYYRPDFTNLIEGETYTLSWFEGTTYHEYTLQADSPYYKIDWVRPGWRDSTYNIEGVLHKEGYASFDLSDIPPGLYYTDMGGLICITE